jgi:tetratricopeptide (TPR) repeat protein
MRHSLAAALLCLLALPGCDDGGDEPLAVPELELLTPDEEEARHKLRLAERLIEAGADASAEPLLGEVVRLIPDDPEPYLLLGSVLIEQGDLRGAAEALRRSRDLGPWQPRTYELLAQTLHALGELDEAEEVIAAWLRLDESSADAHYRLGRVLYLRGDYPGAVASFRRAEAIEQARADIRSELGLALLAVGRPRKAEAKQRDALEREPGNAVAWFRLGDAIAAQDEARRPEAIEAMRRAVELKPRLVHGQLYLYRLLRKEVAAGNASLSAEADRRWTAVLRLHRGFQLVSGGLGEPLDPALTAEGEEQALRRAVAAAPEEPATRLRLAVWLHVQGFYDESLSEYSAVRVATPEDPVAAACSGAAWLARGRPERAEPLLELAVEKDADLLFAWRDLGWARLVLDRPKDALAAYAELLKRAPADPRALKGRGLAMMRAGQLDEGLKQIARAGWLD